MKKKKYGSVKKLADEVGCHRVYLSALLMGKGRPSVALAQRIAKATGEKIWKYRPDLKDILIENL